MSELSPHYNEKDTVNIDAGLKSSSDVADAMRTGSIIERRIVEHSGDADEALKAFQQAEGDMIVLDEETNRRLLRKIDWNLMPMMCAVYMLNFLDKTTISYASVMGLKTDLGLTGTDYSWLGKSSI